MPDLDKYADLELTSQERSAMARLGDSKDFQKLMDVMARWNMKRAYDLLGTPREGQDAELLQFQGGHALLRRMIKYVDESVDTSKPLKNAKE